MDSDFEACVYFCLFFDAYFALIVLSVMTLYVFATIKITDWRTGLRRDMVVKSREEFAIKNDSISNYETVKVIPILSLKIKLRLVLQCGRI
jgi:ABC-type transport system involved in Fe-S cluster assembly fused permease/ATPase subunit